MIKKITFLFLGLLISFLNIQSQTITQIGTNINGNGPYDYLGYSLSMNADGTVIAIGAPSGWYNGEVRVYRNNAGNWQQIGSDITDLNSNMNFGYSISLSADGSVVAIGIPGIANSISGIVRVYRNNSGTWQKLGSDITGSGYGDYLGTSVSLSADGSIVAVGAPEEGYGGSERGHGYVRIFQNNAGTWQQIGNDIRGERPNVNSAVSVSLCADGSVVAIGDLFGGDTYSGQVRIFRNNSGTWEQVGTNIGGTGYHAYYGNSVSLSKDGSIVALGAKGYNNGVGLVRIYKSNADTWQQIGSDINGDNYTDEFGSSVSLSGNGSVIAVGARTNDGNLYGSVRIYKNTGGAWTKINPSLSGVAQYDEAWHVSLNYDGSVIGIGAVNNDAGGDNAGNVRVFHICPVSVPVPVNANLPDVSGVCSATVSSTPTATDDCGNAVTGTTTDPLAYNTEGTHTITWTFTDIVGNKTTQTQKVILDDVTAPVPNVATLPNINAECYVDALSVPTAADACKGTINGVSNVTLPITAIGTTVVTWTYDDGNGNTTTQTQNITITADATSPVPDNASLPAITQECYLKANEITAPTATDHCNGKITGVSNVSSWPIKSNTTITWTYNDGNGHTFTQTQNVIITSDASSPVPDVVTLPDITRECYLKSNEISAPTATDRCAGSITGVNDVASWPITSNTTITWTYNDGNGNTSTQTQNVIIASDASSPVPNVASLPDLTAECKLTQFTAPTATDRCAGTITGTTNTTLPITTLGTTIVTWTYNDGNGHSSTQTQKVTVNPDVTSPVPDVATLTDVTAECKLTQLTAPTATDFCKGKITGTPNVSLPITTAGTTIVTWTYNDGNGNLSTQTQKVIITTDVSNPVPDVASLPDLTAECKLTQLTAPTATDICAGKVTGTPDITLPITTVGTTIVTWTYNDGNGHVASQNQKVIITPDVTKPIPDVASLPDINTQCSVRNLTAPTATDFCAGKITATSNANLPISSIGTNVITWTYNDGNGNIVTQTQRIIITADITAPVPDVAILPDINAECLTTLEFPIATDNCDGKITATTYDYINFSTEGIYNITWRYTDGSGNTSTQTQKIIIDDVTAPVPDVATLPDIDSECEVYVDTPTATDHCIGKVYAETNNSRSYTKEGTYMIAWTYNDFHGNISSQTQKIIIDDVTPPVPHLATLPDLVGECYVAVNNPPSAIDNCKGAIAGKTTDPTYYGAQGTYTITWNYNDGNGNITKQTQKVIIHEQGAPEYSKLTDIVAQCSVNQLDPPKATYTCTGQYYGTHNVTLPITTKGTTIVTWTYDNGRGDILTQTQNVIITGDVTKPVPNIDRLPQITSECSLTQLTAPKATDNCAGTITGTADVTLPITTPGSTLVTWTYNDGNGNSSTQIQNVIITAGAKSPVPDVATLPDIKGLCSATVVDIPTANICAGTITGTTTDPLTYNTNGTHTITWIYNDGNGNISTQTQNVIIEDFLNPVIACVNNKTINLEGGKTYTVSGTEFDPSATNDNCGVAAVANNFNKLSTLAGVHLPIGKTTIVWTVRDKSGNMNSCSFDVQVNLSNVIETIEQSGIVIYPNPTDSKLNLDFANNKILQLQISDLTGKVLIKKTTVLQTEIVDVSGLSAGVYLISILTDKKLVTTKITKE